MTFQYTLTDTLKKRVNKLGKKDRVLAEIFRKKIKEVVAHSATSIDTYKNLKSPQNQFKRIHLTGSHVLLFTVDKKEKFILFVDIVHWNNAYQ